MKGRRTYIFKYFVYGTFMNFIMEKKIPNTKFFSGKSRKKFARTTFRGLEDVVTSHATRIKRLRLEERSDHSNRRRNFSWPERSVLRHLWNEHLRFAFTCASTMHANGETKARQHAFAGMRDMQQENLLYLPNSY